MQLEEFGPFMLVRPLGKGGMGVVYLAKTHLEGYPLAAVKRLRPDVAKVQGFAERFWHEGELARRLRHPRIVEMLDVGEVDGKPYVASTFVVGKSIAAICDRLAEANQGASIAVVVGVLAEALSALAYIHGARDEHGRALQLVHRDITPGNLLVGYDGKTRLADFGLAKSFLSERLMLTGEGMILGTPKYLPVEVVRGEKATRAADIYGLAAVAYRMLSGTAPYEGDVRTVIEATLRGPPRRLRELRPDLPDWLAGFLEKMMQRDLSLRPADAEALHKQLANLARANRVQITYEQMGAWLRELFRHESPVEIAEAEELQKNEVRVTGDQTRVLPPKNTDNRSTAVLGKMGSFGMDFPTEMQSRPLIAPGVSVDVDAPTRPSTSAPAIEPEELPRSARVLPTMSIEPRTLTPADMLPPARNAASDTPPLRPPRDTKTPVLIAVIALLAAALGVLAGAYFMRQDVWPIVHRIEVAKGEIAMRRAAGRVVPAAAEALNTQIDEAVAHDGWPRAAILVGDLEHVLKASAKTSTTP